MRKELSELEARALRLSVKDRARLVRRLIATLDEGQDVNAEQEWLDEAERRLAAYQRGELKTAAV